MARILWAEDGLDDQYLIRHALGQIADPPTVQFVEDGEAALRALAADAPDLTVLDINMPLLDGVTTLRSIRADAKLRSVRVVVFSTARQESQVAACHRLGVEDYLQKPFHYADFTRAVARICELARDASRTPAQQPKARR